MELYGPELAVEGLFETEVVAVAALGVGSVGGDDEGGGGFSGSLVGVAGDGGGVGGYGVGGTLRDGRIEEAEKGENEGRDLEEGSVRIHVECMCVMLVRW